jgi:hypothetical protein
LGLHTNKTRIKKDDKIGNIMALWDNLTDWWTGDDDEYSQTEESAFADLIDSDSGFADLYENVLADPNYGTTDVNSFMYEEDDPFAWLYESDPEFAGELLSDDFLDTENSQYGWNENEASYIYPNESEDDWQGYLGLGIGPKLNEAFTGGEGLSGLLSMLLGGGSGGKKTGGGILGNLIGGSKNMLDNDLIKILLGKKLLDDDREGGSAGYVPIGQEAYGGGGGQPSYQISNIQPALLPGMAYANQPTTYNADPPPGMQGGGIASLENRMEGPGDITKAMLEPGEFVMTRKATENLTPEYLYNLMNQAENAGRRR